MVTKKDLVIAVLATFCLTATIFMVIPTRSQNSNYDPWLDTNDDGAINILDISASAKAFLSSGNPTKSVYVTNPSYDAESTWFNISWSNYTTIWGWTYTPASFDRFLGGFSKLFIHLYVFDISPKPLGEMNTTVYVSGIAWNSSVLLASYEHFDPNRCNATIFVSSQLSLYYRGCSAVGEFEIKAETIEWIAFTLTSIMESGWLQLGICTYLRND
jgi:hypothetical protein